MSAPARRDRRPWLAGSLAVATAVVLIAVLRPGEPPPDSRYAVAVVVERGPTRTRSDSAAVGDTLLTTATLESPDAVWDVRVYRDDGLVTCCHCRAQQAGATMSCVQKGARVEARWQLQQPGLMRVVLFGGSRQAPTTSSFVEDVAAATDAGLQAVPGPPREVF
jgi:hypothetical protein